MKILYFTDCHLYHKSPAGRSDDYPSAILEKLRKILNIAKKEEVDYILCGGDFFHRSTVSFEYLGKVISLLKSSEKKIKCIVGNHDIAGYNKKTLNTTALGILKKASLIDILDIDSDVGSTIYDNIDGIEIAIEGRGYTANYEKPSSYEVTDRKDFNILLCHGMLAKNPILDTIDHTLTSEIENAADITISGHEHKGFKSHKINDCLFMNIGSVARTDSSKEMKEHKPSCMILNLENVDNKIEYSIRKISLKAESDVWHEFYDAGAFISEIFEIEDAKLVEMIDVNEETKKKINSLIDSNSKDSSSETTAKEEKIITKIVLENFKVHEFLEIELTKGLNTIVGKNNVGKSTILKALAWVFYDIPKGNSYIRFGEKECSVSVYYSDGTYIKKNRKKDVTYTVFNGDEEFIFKGVGQKLPPMLEEVHGMRNHDLWGDKMFLNYASQLDGLFLISESGFNIAKAIGKLTNTDLYDNAITLCSKEIKALNDEYKNLENRLKKKEEDFKSLSEEEAKYNKLYEIAEKSFNEMEKIKEVISVVNKIKKYNDTKEILDSAVIKEIKSINSHVYSTIMKMNEEEKLQEKVSIKIKNIKKIEAKDILKILKYNELKSKIDINVQEIKPISINNEYFEKRQLMIKKLKSYKEETNIKKELIEKIENENNEIKNLKEEMGGICPVCGGIYE